MSDWSISGDSANEGKHLLHLHVMNEDLRTLCGCYNHSADVEKNPVMYIV